MAKSIFPHPWWTAYTNIGDPMKCKDEWCIIDISNLIRAKDNWKTKYKNSDIVEKWDAELKPQFEGRTENFKEVFAYVIRELAWYEYFEHNFPGIEENGFHVSIDDKIVVSDSVISEVLKDALRREVSKFTKEEFPEGKFDYHPNSDNTVIDLVHPSLYPLQYGITPIFSNENPEDSIVYNGYRNREWPHGIELDFEKNHGKREIKICEFDKETIKTKPHVSDYGISENYQWLPALLTKEAYNEYNKPGEYYHFRSYINNLHPIKYSNLYQVISKIFNRLLPGLNLCLSRLASGTSTRIEIPMSDDKLYDEEFNRAVEDWDWEGEDADNDYDELLETKKDHVNKFPPRYIRDPPVNYDFNLARDFSKLKVIVKLANIQLTPGNPVYKGGTWHVEGTINEDIVATILYYYDSENITELNLSFRCAFEDPNYEQGDSFAVDHFFGIFDEAKMTKNLGSVETKEDRLLIFPNWFQHHVDQFELKDKTKPGHRKILCMFLVDPHNSTVISTDQVPPQQLLWWEDGTDLEAAGLSKYARQEIPKLKSWPVSLDSIKLVRDELMKERSSPVEEYSEEAFERKFSLCEH